jgi:hypothetical protein
MNWPPIALSLFLLALLPVLISAFYFVDRLIRHEYHFHREAWLRDHRPAYFLFWPPEAIWGRSRLALSWLSMAWCFWAPDWIRSDSAARQLLSRLRWRVLIWNIGAVIWFVLFYFFLIATRV